MSKDILKVKDNDGCGPDGKWAWDKEKLRNSAVCWVENAMDKARIDLWMKVFEELTKWSKESIAFSPTSLWSVLFVFWMFYWEEELLKKVWLNSESQKESFKKMLDQMKLPSSPLKSANWLWIGDSSKVWNDAALELLSKVDFSSPDKNKMADQINAWVKSKTNWMITNLVSAWDLLGSKDVFVNALYFKGTWIDPFNKEKTTQEDFSWTWKVNMMHNSAKYDHISNGSYQAVRMPYNEWWMSMVAFLPNEWKSLDEIIWLANKSLLSWKYEGNWVSEKVDLGFPKFDVSTTNNALQNRLQFTGIKLDISILQKTRVQVDEVGTQAAAATGVMTRSLNMNPSITFNRPFYYAIQDSKGNVHFMGTFMWK